MKDLKMYGMVKVGTKGQIVIPKSTRDDFAIQPNDELFVMTGPHKKGVILFKADSLDAMKQMIDSMSEQVEKLRKQKSVIT